MAGRASIVGAAATHVGKVRDHNEDAHFIDADLGLFLVCDGMGGHAAGEVASDLAIRSLRDEWGGSVLQEVAERWLERGTPEARKQLLDAIRAGVVAAHDSILAEADRDESKSGMGTTLVGAVIVGGELVFAHAGDSRAYLVRDGISMQLTEDHTLLARLLAAGIDVDVSGEGSRFRSMLTNALGIGDEVKVSTFVVPLADGDRFLLCSDGISEYVPENEVGEVLTKQPSPARAAQRLIDLALERGGGDNATAVVVRVLEAGETPLPAEQRKKDDAAIGACALWGKRVTPQQRLRALRIAIPRDHNFGEKLPPHALGDRVAWILLEGAVVQDGESLGPGALIYPESLLGGRDTVPPPPRDALATTRGEVRALAIRANDFRELCDDDGDLGEALLDSLAAMIPRRKRRPVREPGAHVDPRGNTDPQLPVVPRDAPGLAVDAAGAAAFATSTDDAEATDVFDAPDAFDVPHQPPERDRAATVPDEPPLGAQPARRLVESAVIAPAPPRAPSQAPARPSPPPSQLTKRAVPPPPPRSARPSPVPPEAAQPPRRPSPVPAEAAQPPRRPSPMPGEAAQMPLPARAHRPSQPPPDATPPPVTRPTPMVARAAATLPQTHTPPRGVPRVVTPARGVPRVPTPAGGVPMPVPRATPAGGLSPVTRVEPTAAASSAPAAGREPPPPVREAEADAMFSSPRPSVPTSPPARTGQTWAATTTRTRHDSPWDPGADTAPDRRVPTPPKGFPRAITPPSGQRPRRSAPSSPVRVDSSDLRMPADPEIETYLELEADLPPGPGAERDVESELALRFALGGDPDEHESVSITIEDDGGRVTETTTESDGLILTVTITEPGDGEDRQRALTAQDGALVSGSISIPEDTPPPRPKHRAKRQSDGWE